MQGVDDERIDSMHERRGVAIHCNIICICPVNRKTQGLPQVHISVKTNELDA